MTLPADLLAIVRERAPCRECEGTREVSQDPGNDNCFLTEPCENCQATGADPAAVRAVEAVADLLIERAATRVAELPLERDDGCTDAGDIAECAEDIRRMRGGV